MTRIGIAVAILIAAAIVLGIASIFRPQLLSGAVLGGSLVVLVYLAFAAPHFLGGL